MSDPRVAVLGVGGVGGLVAARTGALCVGPAALVDAVRERGLTLRADGGELVTRPAASERLERPVRLLVVAVKAPSLAAALRRVDPEAVDGSVVLPLLNGLEHLEELRAALPGSIVVAGSIGRVEALSPERGVVEQRTPSPALVRAASDALGPVAMADRLEPLAVEGIDLDVGGSERSVLWEKAVRLAPLAAATVATGLPVGGLLADTASRDRLRAALEEACAVAAADGVTLDPAAQWGMIEAMAPTLTTSTARDAAAGRDSELDAISGSVLRAAERLGVPAPALRALFEGACRAR